MANDPTNPTNPAVPKDPVTNYPFPNNRSVLERLDELEKAVAELFARIEALTPPVVAAPQS